MRRQTQKLAMPRVGAVVRYRFDGGERTGTVIDTGARLFTVRDDGGARRVLHVSALQLGIRDEGQRKT